MKINAKRLRQEGLALLCTLIVGFVGFYIFLPPISLQSQQFYLFAGALCEIGRASCRERVYPLV